MQGKDLLDLENYKKSILALLGRIEIGNCNDELKENLKTIYELLSHLSSEKSPINKLEQEAINRQQKKQPIQS